MLESAAFHELEQARREGLSGRAPFGDNPIHDACSMVSAIFYAAEDDLLGLCRLFDSPASTSFAQFVLARAALEGFLVARWLLTGPERDARNRIARFMNYRLRDLTERAKLTASIDANEAQKVRQLRATIIEEAERLGFTVPRNKKNEPLGLEPLLPDTTALAERHFLASDVGKGIDGSRGVILWRFWSGVTHSNWHALSRGVVPVVADSVVPGTTRVDYVTRSRDVLQTFAALGLAYMPTVRAFHLFMGWDEPELRAAEDGVADLVRTMLAPLIQ
jgi:hypothetical protein